MKRKILGIMMASTMLFAVGCEKKKENKEEDKTPRIVCTSEESIEGIKSSSVTTITIRDDKKYVKEYSSKIKMVIDDESMYNLYKEAMQEDKNEDEDVKYTYNFDDANKTIYTTLKVELTDKQIEEADEEEKNEMEVRTLVEKAENSDVKCDFKNITRGDIGL